MGFYIESNDRALKSGIVSEEVPLGCAVTKGSDGVRLMTADDRFEGVADNPQSGHWVAERWDETSDFEYKPSEDGEQGTYHDPFESRGNRATYGGNADGDIIKINCADEDVDLSDGAVVGVGAEAGHLVDEDHADAGEFAPIGVVRRETKDAGEGVAARVEVRKDLVVMTDGGEESDGEEE